MTEEKQYTITVTMTHTVIVDSKSEVDAINDALQDARDYGELHADVTDVS